jgi:predicted HicB family RNase H-like nuclease
MKISKITGRPEQIPSNCTEKFNVRIEPWRKRFFESFAQKKKKSMSKFFLEMMDFYLKFYNRF